MGLRIVEGVEAGTDTPKAVLFDSVSGVALGKVFDTAEQLEAFLAWTRNAIGHDDVRRLEPSYLVLLQDRWVQLGQPGYAEEADLRIEHQHAEG